MVSMRVRLNLCKEKPHKVNIGCTFVMVVFQFLTRFLHKIYVMKNIKPIYVYQL